MTSETIKVLLMIILFFSLEMALYLPQLKRVRSTARRNGSPR